MSLYLYIAKNKKGETQTGHLEAVDRHELASFLRQQGMVLISAEAAEEEKDSCSGIKKVLQKFGRISLVEKMVFTRHLSVMSKAGLPLNKSLQILAKQSKNLKFKNIIGQIEQGVRRGQSFSDCLAKHSKVFNDVYVNMVRVGEASGNLDEVLDILADQMEKDHRLISRVRGAMIYPAVIIVTMLGIGIIMMITVVPKITAIFLELNIELPITTRIIIGLSNFLRSHFILGLIIFISFIFLIKLALKNKTIKRAIHEIYLRLPIFGPLTQKVNSARFARIISSLIESGVVIVKALQIAAGTLGNIHFKESLINTAEQVQKGEELSTALAKHKNIYPPMIIQMVQVGEETGKLTDILKTLANFYEQEIDNTTKNLSSVIEPIIMVVIGAAVGFFAISIIQPMYSMMGGI